MASPAYGAAPGAAGSLRFCPEGVKPAGRCLVPPGRYPGAAVFIYALAPRRCSLRAPSRTRQPANPSYSRRWRRRRADFPLMVGCAVARCVCFAAASGRGVGAGGSRGWIAGAMVAPSFMALSASTPPRCGGSTRPLGRQQQRRGGRGKPSRQPARRASRAAGEWC